MDHKKVEGLIRELLIEIGEDPDREGLVQTPHRMAKAFDFLTSGYRADSRSLINGAIFTQETNNMVIARDIEIYSLCEHHMLPWATALSPQPSPLTEPRPRGSDKQEYTDMSLAAPLGSAIEEANPQFTIHIL